MSAQHLPDTLIQEIGCYLDVYSLFSLSCTCSRWNDVLNVNKVWRQAFINTFGKDSLKTVLKAVEDEHLCKWKSNVSNKLRLMYNWKNEIFRETKFSLKNEALRMECDEDIVVFFFSTTRRQYYFQVYDLMDHETIQEVVFCALQTPIRFTRLCDGLLVIVQDNLVQVFVKDDTNRLTLTQRFLYDQENCKPPENSVTDLTEWHSSQKFIFNLRNVQAKTVFTQDGEYFICVEWETIIAVMIWDLKSGKKLDDAIIEDDMLYISSIDVKLLPSRVYLSIRSVSGLETKIYGYDIKRQTFLPVNHVYDVDAHVHFSNKYIFTVLSGVSQLEMWDAYEPKFIQRLYFLFADAVAYFDNPVSVFCYPYFIFSAANLEQVIVVDVISCQDIFIDKYGVQNIMPVKPSLILISSGQAEDIIFELWDFTQKHVSQQISVFSGSNALVTPSGTTLVLTRDYWCKNTDVIIKQYWFNKNT